MSELPRHPEDVQPPPLCVVCHDRVIKWQKLLQHCPLPAPLLLRPRLIDNDEDTDDMLLGDQADDVGTADEMI
ncbi:hypothetical protein LshimejAT787_1104430 [Lyophyllum shimeji]|uniref:Uncharacterized protein n=1 Tax=Lyophyllum shimeji TaxID=47721 RepID=A0A9P3UR93_LYOSH|nr:hypothetical protein LshimejAT787_1104430 [Lyophyllum shimeji]